MKPHTRKQNEALYKLRRFKTIGDIMHFDPTSRFMFRFGSKRNQPNENNARPTKARRTEGRFLKLTAFKLVHNLSH